MKEIRIELGKDYVLLKGINYKINKIDFNNDKIIYNLTLNEGIDITDIYMIDIRSLELYKAVTVNDLGFIERWSVLGKFIY